VLRVAAVVLTAEFDSARMDRLGGARGENHIVQIFESLSATDILTMSIDELAAKFCCSRRHLNRLFHLHFGSSVAALRMEMRLIKAISLLRDPDAKVINVAEHCGFNHLGLFNTCFRRRFGTSPGQWRKSGAQAFPFSKPVATASKAIPPSNNSSSPAREAANRKVVEKKVYELMRNAFTPSADTTIFPVQNGNTNNGSLARERRSP